MKCRCNYNTLLELQQSILPPSIQTLPDKSTETAKISWAALSGVSKPTGQQCCIQKAWDGPVSANQLSCIFSHISSDTDKARLLAASSPHTGDWLHTPPIASVRRSSASSCGTKTGMHHARPVNYTLVCLVKQSVHDVSTAWHVAEVVQDISATANSTTSYGGLSKEQEYQL